jgi:DNA repair protein RecO (recombination protein O)
MITSHLYTVEGVILKRKNIGEADKMLTVFTKTLGKIRVIAKGVRKINSRRAGHIEIFGRVVLTLHKGKTWDIVTEATSDHTGWQGATFPQIQSAYFLCELIDELIPDGQTQEDAYSLLETALLDVGKLSLETDMHTKRQAFVHDLLWMLGFLPPQKILQAHQVEPFLESIIEKKLKTYTILTG